MRARAVFRGLLRSRLGGRPFHAHVLLTRRCDFRCRMCGVRAFRDAGTELSAEAWRDGAEVLARTGVASVVLTGGEPFLRDDLAEIVRGFAERGLSVKLQTGGGPSASLERLREVVEAGATDLHFSLDSLRPDVQERIWCRRGAWKEVVPKIQAARGLMGGGTVAVSAVMSRWNLRELPALADFVHDAGGLFFVVPILLRAQDGPSEPFRGSAPDMALTARDRRDVRAVVRKLVRRKRAGRRIGSSVRYLWAACRYLESGCDAWRCGAGTKYLEIRPDGAVAPCSDLPALCPDLSSFAEEFARGAFQEKARGARRSCAGCLQACWREAEYVLTSPAALAERARDYVRALHP